jgi:hypothetical protein
VKIWAILNNNRAYHILYLFNVTCRGDYRRGLGFDDWTLYTQKLALTSLASGDLLVGIVRLRTKATEFVCLFFYLLVHYSQNSGLQAIQRYRYFHTLKFTVTHALGFSAFTSRILATDL